MLDAADLAVDQLAPQIKTDCLVQGTLVDQLVPIQRAAGIECVFAEDAFTDAVQGADRREVELLRRQLQA